MSKAKHIPTTHIRIEKSPEGVTSFGRGSKGLKITTVLLDGIIPGWLVEGPGAARQFFPASNVLKAQLADNVPKAQLADNVPEVEAGLLGDPEVFASAMSEPKKSGRGK